MKEIKEPSLDKNNQILKGLLWSHGISNIVWIVDDKCFGNAMSDIDDNNNGKIIFRNENLPNDQFLILHELLHLFLHVEGYPKVVASDFGDAIQQLDNIFSHIIMSPYLDKFGSSFRKLQVAEWLGIERSITKLKEIIVDYKGDNLDKLLLNIIYIRAKSMGLPNEKLEDWKNFLKFHDLYDENIIKTIESNLPKPNSSIEGAAKQLEKCINELNLSDVVSLRPFLPRKSGRIA